VEQQEIAVWSTVKAKLEASGGRDGVRHTQPAIRRGGRKRLVRKNTVCFLLIPTRTAAGLQYATVVNRSL